MSVTTTTYTTNSKKITISNETSSTNFISALDTAITGLGWSSYDTVATTLFNPITTRVYRALNYDGVTYKYCIIRIDTVKLIMHLSTCESWNTSTKTPTNETWQNAGVFQQGYDLVNSYVIVSATARHIVLWNFINNQPGLWTAVLEFERIASEDVNSINTTPYPCWAYTNSLMIGTPYCRITAAAPSQYMFSFPRLPDGKTGEAAAYSMAPVTNRGMFPPFYVQDTTITATDINALHLGSYSQNLSYGFDVQKSLVSPISVDGISVSQPFGRAYNLGVCKSIGAAGDTVLANIDATGGWPSSTGSQVESLLLPMNGGYENQNGVTSGGITQIYANTNVIAGKCIAIGDNVWFAANDGIRTCSISAGQGASSTQRLINGLGIFDIVYDGKTTIYGSAANGIVKIDTVTYANSYATSSQTIANGCGYLGIDNKNVYAGPRIGNVYPTVVTLDQATFTISTGNTFVMPNGNATSILSVTSTPVPDYTGNVWVSTVPGTSGTGGNVMYINEFSANTGTANFLSYIIPSSAYGYAPTSSIWIDYFQTQRVFVANAGSVSSSSAADTRISWFEMVQPSIGSRLTITNLGTLNTVTGTGPQPIPGGFSDNSRLGGDLFVTPLRGTLITGAKYQGRTPVTSGSADGFQTIKFGPIHTLTSRALHTIATTNINAQAFGRCAGIYTNTVSYFAPFYAGANDNRLYMINGVYNTTSVMASATSRLILRG